MTILGFGALIGGIISGWLAQLEHVCAISLFFAFFPFPPFKLTHKFGFGLYQFRCARIYVWCEQGVLNILIPDVFLSFDLRRQGCFPYRRGIYGVAVVFSTSTWAISLGGYVTILLLFRCLCLGWIALNFIKKMNIPHIELRSDCLGSPACWIIMRNGRTFM